MLSTAEQQEFTSVAHFIETCDSLRAFCKAHPDRVLNLIKTNADYLMLIEKDKNMIVAFFEYIDVLALKIILNYDDLTALVACKQGSLTLGYLIEHCHERIAQVFTSHKQFHEFAMRDNDHALLLTRKEHAIIAKLYTTYAQYRELDSLQIGIKQAMLASIDDAVKIPDKVRQARQREDQAPRAVAQSRQREDQLRQELDLSQQRVDLAQQRVDLAQQKVDQHKDKLIGLLEQQIASKQQNKTEAGLSWQVLNGFMIVLGVSAVAIAFATCGIVPAVLFGAGLTLTFFCVSRCYANCTEPNIRTDMPLVAG